MEALREGTLPDADPAGVVEGRSIMDVLTRFLTAVAVILGICHILGAAAHTCRQPRVIGEIVGGLLLGPSVLGAMLPSVFAWLFPPVVLAQLSTAAQLGLVIFVFLLGSELNTSGTRVRAHTVAITVVCAVAIPYTLGILTALGVRTQLAGPAGGWALVFFLGLALSVTALPVLARILVDLRMEHTSVGITALTVAAIGDGFAWAVLTVIIAVTSAGGPPPTMKLLIAIGWILVTLLLIRPVARSGLRRHGDRPGAALLAMLTACAIGFAAIAQLLGLHPLIGAFLFGAALPSEAAVVRVLDRQLRGFAVVVLLPLFFAGVGLNTQLGLLGAHLSHWAIFAGVLLAASVGKFTGGVLGGRAAGWRGRDRMVLGVLMNCRGVTELVVAGIGWQAGLINGLGFTILVLMALITTGVTGPLLRWLGYPEEQDLSTDPSAAQMAPSASRGAVEASAGPSEVARRGQSTRNQKSDGLWLGPNP
jgi:Kef-type K+ transport system membrane component KefB